MAGLAISQRLKEARGKALVWRYKRVAEGRGVKTGHLQPPFYIRPTLADGTQPWVKLDSTTFEEAKRERDRRERGEQLEAENDADRLLISDAVANFLDDKKRSKPKTIQRYMFDLNQFIENLPDGVKFIDQLLPEKNRKTSRVLDAHATLLSEKGDNPRTVANKMGSIFSMMKNAGVENSSKMVELEPYHEEPAQPYSEEELEKLFEAMNPQEAAIFKFFLITACREQEVAHATWDDLVYEDKIPKYWIREKTYKTVAARGYETKEVRWSPKSTSSKKVTTKSRKVPLSDELVDMLKELKRTSKSKWLFPNEDGNPNGHFLRSFKKVAFCAGLNCGNCHVTRNEGRYVKTAVEKCCKDYSEGCEKHYLHRLRKTRATFWHRNGVDIRTIQNRLGHEDLGTTQKYLGITDDAELKKVDNKPMF